jgi:hypothetical protein
MRTCAYKCVLHARCCNIERVLQLPRYLGTAWSGSFSLIPDLEERQVTMTPEEEDSLPTRHLALSVRLQAASLHVFAPFWLLNKTGLPLQIRVSVHINLHFFTSCAVIKVFECAKMVIC